MSNDVDSWTGNADHHSQYTQQWVDASSSAYASVDERSVIPEAQDQGFATQLYRTCLHVFRHLCNEAKDHGSQRLRLSSLKDELAKLYLWGEDFGGAELDDVLEHSEDVRKVVLELLGDIGRTLLRERKALLLKAGAKMSPQYDPSASLPAQQQTVELRKLVDQIKGITNIKSDNETREDHIFCTDSDDTDEDSSSDDDDPHNTLEDLEFSTRRLVELGPALHQNLYYVEKARLQISRPPAVPFSVSEPAWIYVSHVREKFNRAQTRLVERLGEANWQRHRDVRRRMDAIANPNEDHDDEHEQGDGITCSVFYPSVAFHDSGIGTSVPAQTFYAQSHTSFQSNDTEGEQGSLRVPDTPTEVNEGKAFKCFLCGQMLSKIKSRVDWKLHVFADLKPYICTFTDCEHELAQFQNRAAWAEHEFNEHRLTKLWICPECPKECPSLATWEAHLQEQHKRIFSGPHLQLAQRMAYSPQERPIEVEECPLCRSVLGKPRREFVKHVGRHMEQIALMALPREATDDSDAESACTTQENSSHAFIGSKGRSPRRSEGRNASISVSDDELDAVNPQGSIGKANHPEEHWREVHTKNTRDLHVKLKSTSSYWSVPEQSNFEKLLHQFGSDFEAIAESMKTKTARMVRNYYNRKVAEGGEVGRALEATVQAVELTKLSTEEVDQAHIHVQPAYDPQVYSRDTSPGLFARIPKNETYVRPQHPKAFCDKCNIKPEGFRGPHELRRHYENKHAQFRTVWVCVDRSSDKKFLSKCKHCVEGKHYGAYYNAAAHLRRFHFAPEKFKSRGRIRGADGGRDDPTMEMLMEWVQGVSVPNGPRTQEESDESVEGDVGEEDAEGEDVDEMDRDDDSRSPGSRASTPDVSKMTKRQRSRLDQVMGSDEDAIELIGTVASGGETGTSLRDHEYDPAGKKRPEAPHLETPNGVDPFGQQADVSVDEKSQGPTTGEKRRNFQNLLRDSQRLLTPSGFKSRAAQVSAQMIELGDETTENRITIALPKKTQQQVTGPHLGTFIPEERSRQVFATRETVEEKEQREMQARQQSHEAQQANRITSPQEPVKKTRKRRPLARSQRKQTAATRRIGACIECRRRKKRCPHGLLGNSMNPEDPAETPTSLTSSTVPINDPLLHTPQTTQPTSDPIQNLSSKTIDDPRIGIPPFPLAQPVDTEPPSDNGLDQGNSPEPTNEVERRSKVAMVVDDDLDIKIEKGPPPPRELSQLSQEHKTYVFSHSTPNDFSLPLIPRGTGTRVN